MQKILKTVPITYSNPDELKVMLIDVNFRYTSTGKLVSNLHESILREKKNSVVCYGRGPFVDQPNIFKFSSNSEVYLHVLAARLTGLNGYFSFFSTNKLISLFKQYKPDIVHIHELHGYYVNINAIVNYLIRSRIRTIWTFHCEFMYTGKCGHAYECEKWKTECDHCPKLHEYPSSWVWDQTKKMFNDKRRMFENFENLIIVTPSKWLRNRVQQSFLKDKENCVIHNGIDNKIFRRRESSHLRRKHYLTSEKVVLAVAPDLMSDRKGGRYVVELAKSMLNESEKIKFILIGVDDLNEEFDRNVIALGRINDQEELATYYSMADVFVICSSKENFPTTCIEAISCGTPVCGFDEGGTKETAPGELGAFVNFGDIESLKKSIIAFLKKPNIKNLCEDYGRAHYSKELMYQKYLKLYLQEKN